MTTDTVILAVPVGVRPVASACTSRGCPHDRPQLVRHGRTGALAQGRSSGSPARGLVHLLQLAFARPLVAGGLAEAWGVSPRCVGVQAAQRCLGCCADG
jgi:hypothetical protein